MDLTQDIFIKLPTFEKEAYANLSTNVGDWVHDITKMVYDKLSFITKFPTKIKLERVDEQRGFGYGSVKVGQTVDIPLIIKNFELQPMDVYLYQGKFFPLSEQRLEEVLFNAETFGKPSDVSGLDQSIYQSNYPPHSGKYVYAAQNLLSKLDDQIKKEDKDRFVEKVASDIGIYEAFKASGQLKLLKKALSLKERVYKEPSSILPVNIVQIEKLGSNEFKVTLASDRLYNPKEAIISKKSLCEKFSSEVSREVLERGVFTTIQGTRPYRPVLVEDVGEEAKNIKSSGKYQVMDILGDLRLGWVYPNVIDFDVKKTGDKLFTDHLAYSLQSDIVGVDSSSASHAEDGDGIKYSEPQEGKTGVFLFSREGKEVVTIPFTVCSPIFDLGTHIRFEASDFYGRSFIIEITSGVKSITKSKNQESTYLVPADVRYIELGRKIIRLQDSTKEYKINSEAEKNAKEKDIIIITSDDGNVYNLAGSNLGDVAADARGVGHTKAKWYLVSLGMEPKDAEFALKRAKCSGRAKVIDTKVLLTHAEKLGEVLRDSTYQVFRNRPQLRIDLIKEASFLDDEQTVDKVLALNFVTPENEATFLAYLPSLEDAVQKLAQLLIAVRVGMKRIPESAVKSAMTGMETTISGLRSMEALKNVRAPEDSVQ